MQFVSAILDGQPIISQITQHNSTQNLIRFSVPDMSVNGEQTILIRTRVVSTQSTAITNQAVVRTRESDPEFSNNNNNAQISITQSSAGAFFLLRTVAGLLINNLLIRISVILFLALCLLAYTKKYTPLKSK